MNMLIKNESSSNDTPALSDPQNDFKLSYESIEKAEILDKYFCSISNLKDENKVLPYRMYKLCKLLLVCTFQNHYDENIWSCQRK